MVIDYGMNTLQIGWNVSWYVDSEKSQQMFKPTFERICVCEGTLPRAYRHYWVKQLLNNGCELQLLAFIKETTKPEMYHSTKRKGKTVFSR